jgi:hypothetical protein
MRASVGPDVLEPLEVPLGQAPDHQSDDGHGDEVPLEFGLGGEEGGTQKAVGVELGDGPSGLDGHRREHGEKTAKRRLVSTDVVASISTTATSASPDTAR